ncbi:MAG: NADPH-dependent F420 reductase [Anaerolineae bacterium]|nr:NADPH-dependent F420 reductase [Anaerolineae bacterium]MDW8171423.1 NADPH-dependent F420 reductase [Anaerolineae bacterium]
MSDLIQTIAVLGGTGKEGSALALRWALKGYKVIVGSRSAEKAQATAAELNTQLVEGEILLGMSNADAAAQASIVVLSVPYDAHKTTLESVKPHLEGKVLVDLTVPLAPPSITKVHIPEGKSACLEAQTLLGSGVRVVAAFQNVSAVKLKDPNNVVDCDVLVCADDDEAKADVIALVAAAGLRGIDAGPLANAVAAEALTPVLLWINKKYKVKGAGIRITGLAD